MDLGLQGKTALITGASRGIGLAIAKSLVQEECNVTLVVRDAASFGRAIAEIPQKKGVQIRAITADLADSNAVTKILSEAGNLDILVNNAGAIPVGRLGDLPEDEWRNALEIKLFSYTRLAQGVFRSMALQGQGTILNVIGTAGDRPRAGYAMGSMANAALIAMTRALGLQGSSCGVRVVGLHPGATRTERKLAQLQARALAEFGDSKAWPQLAARYPFGRLAEPHEIAHCATFLCSELAAYVNATCVTVDGGATDAMV